MALKLTPKTLLLTLGTGGANLLLEQLAHKTGMESPLRPIGEQLQATVSKFTAPLIVNAHTHDPYTGKFPPRVHNDTSTGPQGWLGFLMNHYAACFGFELIYMGWHESCLSPRIKGIWHSTGNGYVEIDADANYLMQRRFAETQAPSWGVGYGPSLAVLRDDENGSPWSLQDSWIKYLLELTSEGDSPPSSLDYRLDPEKFAQQHDEHADDHFSRVMLVNPALIAYRYNEHWKNTKTVGRRTLDAAQGDLLALAQKGKTLTPSAYWSSDPILTRLWASRIVRWFDNAQAGVYACEMARIHSASFQHCPSWWTRYANAWGVAVFATADYTAKSRYNHFLTHHDDSIAAGMACDLSSVSISRWEKIARALMRAAPTPGTAGYMGEQIADEGKKRHILDMPPSCGSLRPPVYVEGIYDHFIGVWCHGESFKEAAVVAIKWVNSVIGAVASAAGGSAVASAISAMDTAYAAAGTLLRQIARMANGGGFMTLGDALDVVASIANCTAAVSELTGISVDELLPDGVWNALTTPGAVIPEWGGVLKEMAADEATRLQGYFTDLVQLDNWPYLNEGFSTLIPGKL